MAEESIGGIEASVSVDASNVPSGVAVVDAAMTQITERLRDASGRFAAMGAAAKAGAADLAASASGAKAHGDALGYQIEMTHKSAAANAQAAETARTAAMGQNQALMSTFVSLGSVQQAGLKYQDTLRAQAAALDELGRKQAVAATQASATTVQYAAGLNNLRGSEAATQRYIAAMNKLGPAGAANLGKIAASSGMAGNRLLVMGQTLDDLQYVPEMGLRPILNNIMQISPAIGIALIAVDTLRKHGHELAPAFRAVGDYWLGSMEKIEGTSSSIMGPIETLKAGITGLGKVISELGEGWDALTKKKELAQSADIAKFESSGSADDKTRGAGVARAIEAYGPKRFLEEAIRKEAEIDPALRDPANADALREAKARLVGLVEKAKEGDRNALLALERRTKGTGVGVAIADAVGGPGANERAADKKLADEHDRQIKEEEATAESAVAGAVSALQERFNRRSAAGIETTPEAIASEIVKAGLPQSQQMQFPVLERLRKNYEEAVSRRAAEKGLSFADAEKDLSKEAEAKAKKARDDKFEDQLAEWGVGGKAVKPRSVDDIRKDKEEMGKLAEKDSDLRYRIMELRNPAREGKSLGGDAYEASFKSVSGMTEEAKQLHRIRELQEELVRNSTKMQVIAVRNR